MKDLLFITHFTQVPGEQGNGRFNYIAEKINKIDYDVEIVTSNFSHKKKKQRVVTQEQLNESSYKLTMLYEPGYKNNVSIRRFYSHYVMSKSLKKYLQNRKKPDIIYCSVPSLDVAKVAAEYAKKNNIKFIIDIQDLWPEAFKMVFNFPLIGDILFYPMKKKADYIYSTADDIVAVSQTYANRALQINNKCKKAHVVFLGTDLDYFDRLSKNNKLMNKPENEIWLVYIGTLGHSYDLTCVINALRIIKDKGIKNIKFVVMGDGPLEEKFKNYAKKQEINIEFTGRLEYGSMVGKLVSCDIAVNPIKAGSAGSIINKVGDYAAAGLPVLNTQESFEYRSLIDKYQVGFNCKNNDEVDLADKLLKLYKDENLRKKMSNNSRRLAREKFDRSETYQEIFRVFCNNDDLNFNV